MIELFHGSLYLSGQIKSASSGKQKGSKKGKKKAIMKKMEEEKMKTMTFDEVLREGQTDDIEGKKCM